MADGMIEMNQSAIYALCEEAYERGKAEQEQAVADLKAQLRVAVMQIDGIRKYAESVKEAYLPLQEMVFQTNLEIMELRKRLGETKI